MEEEEERMGEEELGEEVLGEHGSCMEEGCKNSVVSCRIYELTDEQESTM